MRGGFAHLMCASGPSAATRQRRWLRRTSFVGGRPADLGCGLRAGQWVWRQASLLCFSLCRPADPWLGRVTFVNVQPPSVQGGMSTCPAPGAKTMTGIMTGAGIKEPMVIGRF